jgi:large subunit ribosomal protein L24
LQATLLGIAVAIILALVAALAGPHFVDWTQYRARFEGEATRLVGMPVRIAGPIELTLLPTPTLMFGQVEIGSAGQPQAKVRELYAELALGALMRGDFRASDLRVTGPETALGLSGNGQVEWPSARIGFEPDRLQIDRIAIEDGKIAFNDRASGSNVSLEGFWFKGDLRSLLGPVKGEGGFIASGERYGYRLAASKVSEDGASKLKLSIDPADHPLAIEADGALRLDQSSPRFEGALTLTRPAAVAIASGRSAIAVPWRASAKVKADPSRALFEQLEYTYGPDDRALRLSGTAELRFGKTPRFDSVLSARQADLDRALGADPTQRLPVATLKAFLEPFASSYRPSIPVHVGLGIDAVTLGGGTLQSVRGDLALDADGWDIETLELRAPGFAQVRLSGRLSQTADGVNFKGPAQVEASDPKTFLAWLEGRDAVQGQAGTLKASGDLTVGPLAVAVERLKFEFDRKTIEGRFAYAATNGAKPARLDAELKAPELDVDAVLAFGRGALGGTAFERPREISLAVDVGRATIAGVEVRGVSGTFKLDPDGLTFDRVRIADLAEASFSLNGRVEGALDAPRGTLTFDVDARGLDGTVAVLAKYFPQAAEPLRQAAPKITPLKAKATLGIEPVSSTDPRGPSKVKVALDGTAGPLRVKIGAEGAGDVASLVLPEYRLDAQIAATDGTVLIGVLGLDRALNVDKRPGALSVVLRSAAGSDARLETRLTAGGLSASANGTARLFSASGLAAALDLTLQAADAGPLRRGTSTGLLPVALRAKLNAKPDEVALDGIIGNVANLPVRGKLKLALPTGEIAGQIDADSIDVPALIALASGMPRSPRPDGAWSSEPFENALGALSGRVQFTAARATFTPALGGRQLRGAVRFGADEIAFEDIEGTLAGGRATAALDMRRGTDGLSARAKFSVMNADASAFLPAEHPVIAGRLGLQGSVEGGGLSPASLIGALNGSGMIVIEDGQLANLDPKAFNAAIGASDRGVAIDAGRIRDIVTTVLDGGPLGVPRLDAAFSLNAGQLRIPQTIVYGQGADILFSGGADLSDSSLDAKLTLTGPAISEGTSTNRPEISVALKGPIAAPKRTVDVAALSGWLMLRSVERQSKRLDQLEAERQEFERREAERKEAERRDAERKETERREAERKEAERKAAERRDAEARAVTSTLPTALPAPIMQEEGAARPRPVRPKARDNQETAAPPPLPPPMNIGPPPGAEPRRARPAGQGAQAAPPPPPPRSALDALFGLQR